MIRNLARGTMLLAAVIWSAPTLSCQLPIANQVTISSRNQILWNGREIDRLTLINYLQIVDTMNPVPVLLFDYTTGANCGIVGNVAHTIVSTSKVRSAEFGNHYGPPLGRGCKVLYHRVKSDSGGWCGPTEYYFLRRPE